ncbi:hypothetical protein HHK36_032632 [Tetracentron sinense]|uniref:Uncharacterized protein n=1 Tax=Tetracentron sinense TaxID=13715 RepID=A0A834Y7K3_TETSI|nr:hypothetical protein HHK36_032632 [Tetracentron sinense]
MIASLSAKAPPIFQSPESPADRDMALVSLRDVELDDIDIKYSGVKAKSLGASSACSNAKVVYSGVQNPPPCP